MAAPKSIKTTVNYLGNDVDDRPYWGSPATGKGCNIRDTTREVTVTDVRSLPEEDHKDFQLDIAGFQFVKHESVEKEFPNDQDKLQRYYRECEELLKKVTGASQVLVNDCTIRRSKWGDGNYHTGPATRVHCDITPKAGFRRVKDSMGDDAEMLLKGRCQVINMWRPIRGPVMDAPLAFADARSLDMEKDCVVSDLIYPTYTGETFAIRPNENHKWYFQSDMMPDDVLLFKCFDSKVAPGLSRMTPHTAFFNPDAPKDIPHRHSIEVRALVFHNEDQPVGI